MVPCRGCGLLFKARLGKGGFCCGHCSSRSGHGKSCTALLLCKSRNGELPVWQGKWIDTELYCCGHCSRSAAQRHGRRCLFRGVIEHAERRSRSPRREIQGSRSSSLLRATEDHAASGSSPSHPLCVVCEDNACTMVCIPCGHLVLCQGCSSEMERLSREATSISRGTRCPICRSECTFFHVRSR